MNSLPGKFSSYQSTFFSRNFRLAFVFLSFVSALSPADADRHFFSHRHTHYAHIRYHVRESAHHKALIAQHNARLAALQLKHQVAEKKLKQQHEALLSHNVVRAAYAFRGTRYVMGGTSRSGFDCSGFVRYILGNAGGVELPRTALEQYLHGTPVLKSQLQPGDLVFFKNTYKAGISHVGIYAGGGQFIHAANPSKGVRMDSLSEPYYENHYAGARRVLPSELRELASIR